MRNLWRPLALSCLVLAIAGLAGCAGSPAPPAAPTAQRRALSAPGAAASPVILSAASGQRPGQASPQPSQEGVSLRLPTDGRQVVLVDSTQGEGVWVRRQPAGEPLRIWPDGAPMLVVGEEQYAEGRVWRHVQTLDGEIGWAAADFLFQTDAAALGIGAGILSQHGLHGRVAVGEATPAAPTLASVAATPTPPASGQAAAPAASKPSAAYIGQPAAPPTPRPATNAASGSSTALAPTSTSVPVATPIRAPAGARSMEAGPTTLAVLGTERSGLSPIGNRPRSGMELVAVQVRVTNREIAPFALYRGAFRLSLSDRSRVEPLAGGPSPLPYSSSVGPGEQVEGWLTFEIPSGTRVDGLIWAPERDVAYALGV